MGSSSTPEEITAYNKGLELLMKRVIKTENVED